MALNDGEALPPIPEMPQIEFRKEGGLKPHPPIARARGTKFCRACGSYVVKQVCLVRYEELTGEKITHWRYRCMKYRWWKPWTWHDC